MGIVSRPYRGDTDLRAMQDLLSRSWLTDRPFVGATAGDLAWWRFMHEQDDWSERIRCWTDDTTGELAGYAWFQPPADMDWHVQPGLRAGPIPRQMLEWAEERSRSYAATIGLASPAAINAWVLEADVSAVAALVAAGCRPGPAGYNHHARPLRGPARRVAEPIVPDGYVVRSVRGSDDLAGRVALHRAVWAPSKVTEASFAAVMSHYPYRPDTDIVVEAPDGSFAAYAQGWFDPLGRVGELEPVGTHPDHRRLGLAHAACLTAVLRLAELGAETAVVYSAVEMTARTDGRAASGLYVGLGMPIVSVHRPYSWPLGGGEAAGSRRAHGK